jgi:AraC family transcriptional regulator
MQLAGKNRSAGADDCAPLVIRRGELGPGERELQSPHAHLVFVSLAGGAVVHSDAHGSVRHRLRPGCVALHPAGHFARWRVEDRVEFSLLRLDADFVARVAMECFGVVPDALRFDPLLREADPALAGLAGAMTREDFRRDAGSRLHAQSVATLLALHLLREYAPARPVAVTESAPVGQSARAVARAVAFMRENFSREIGLREIADEVHVSGSHLTRLFRHALGVTPYRYLLQMRVENARSLLAAGAGRRSLAEVAAAFGFCDQSHLTRHCKRLLGATPGQLQAGLLPQLTAARRLAA